MTDTFKQLIEDMREMGAIQSESDLDPFANWHADRLEKLLDELNPYLLPMYGAVGVVEPIDSDPPPILADMLGSEPPPGSDWTLVHPVQTVENDPVTGDR